MNENIEMLTCAAVWTLCCAGLFFVSYAIAAVIQAFRGRAAALHECRKLHVDLNDSRAEMHEWREYAISLEKQVEELILSNRRSRTAREWTGVCNEDKFLEIIEQQHEEIKNLRLQLRTYDKELQRRRKRGERGNVKTEQSCG